MLSSLEETETAYWIWSTAFHFHSLPCPSTMSPKEVIFSTGAIVSKVLQYYEMSCFSNLGSHCHLVDSVAQTNSFLYYSTLVVRKAEPNPQSWPILYECLLQLFNTHLRILFCCVCWFRMGSQHTDHSVFIFCHFLNIDPLWNCIIK